MQVYVQDTRPPGSDTTQLTIGLQVVLLRKLECLDADAGDCLNLPPAAARLLIAEGWAEWLVIQNPQMPR